MCQSMSRLRAVPSASVPSETEMQSWVQEVVDELAFAGECEVSIRIVDEEEGRELNKQYRDKDGATNVLSFPADNAQRLGTCLRIIHACLATLSSVARLSSGRRADQQKDN